MFQKSERETQIAGEDYEATAVSLNERFERSQDGIKAKHIVWKERAGEKEGRKGGREKREEQKKEGKGKENNKEAIGNDKTQLFKKS